MLKRMLTLLFFQFISHVTSQKKNKISKLSLSDLDIVHEVIIVVKFLSTQEQLHDILMERSTPGSALYQQWLTIDEIGKLTQNDMALQEIKKWTENNNITISYISKHGHNIGVTASIGVWENILQTKFHYWEDTRQTDNTIYYHRSESYTIPTEIQDHVTTILKTSQFPLLPVHHGVTVSSIPKSNSTSTSCDEKTTTTTTSSSSHQHESNMRLEGVCSVPNPCPTTIPQLNTIYGISNNLADSTLSQAVFQTNSETFSQTDLTNFQNRYSLKLQQASVLGTTSSNTCDPNYCSEGNLDIQVSIFINNLYYLFIFLILFNLTQFNSLFQMIYFKFLCSI